MAFHAKHGSDKDWIDDELDLNEDVLEEMFGDPEGETKRPRHGAVASDEPLVDEEEFLEDEFDEGDVLETLDSEQPEETAAPKAKRERKSFPEWFKSASIVKKILTCILGVFIVACVGVGAVCVYWLQDLPEYDDASAYNTIQPTMVYASDHETLLARFQFEYRIPLNSLEEVGTYATQGTVATEDERFYIHIGVDPIGIARAVINNMTGGTLEGASTITQQLVRNTILADEMSEVTLKRKVREAFLAIQMERMFSKDEILLLYINTINYGNGAYGIEAASRRYFGKSSNELTLAEAALLVGIPQSPTYNNPIDFPDHALDRRNIVLNRMVSYGAITQEEAEAAKQEPIELNVTWESNDGIVEYPYFASYVRETLTSDYGLSTADVFQGGMTVYTTLDVTMQEQAEEAAANKEDRVNDALEVAIVAIDPSNGYVKAMVGGKDYYEDQWNLAAQAQRQAGSSFKTFTLIAALEGGISPQTPIDCGSMVQLPGYDNKIYNYDKIKYGTQTMQGAFEVSSNTGFSRLIWVLGADKVAEVAHRMGIESDLAEVPSLTLGTSGVTPLEMCDAYATIANGGTHYKAEVVEIAYDRKGNVIIDNTNPEGEKALEPEIAHAATEIMEGVIYSYHGTGSAAALDIDQIAAGKTGTSENYLNLWFCGITPQLSVAVWMGDRTNRVSCTGTVADVFSDFVSEALADSESRDFPEAGYPSYWRTFSNTDLDIKGLNSSTKEEEEEEKKKKE
ncbi:MAG: transglycosylase domain-containing protein, partial [Eggerthellaceae bacterium]|nr:transglycosylase domain-containing protein [Eggerthellaceae bacterium]